MRALTLRFAKLFVILVLLSSAFAQTQPVPWSQLKYPPLPAFQPQQPTRIQLANGMVIFLQPDHELPLISATARIR
ncbi:MAG: insulinase family protein, partial [Candidatus Korobacteraceae bacterium]